MHSQPRSAPAWHWKPGTRRRKSRYFNEPTQRAGSALICSPTTSLCLRDNVNIRVKREPDRARFRTAQRLANKMSATQVTRVANSTLAVSPNTHTFDLLGPTSNLASGSSRNAHPEGEGFCFNSDLF